MSMQRAEAAFTGKTAWARNLASPVRDFLSAESGGAVALLAAVAAALIWANSPWSDSYESFWTTKLSVTIGSGVSDPAQTAQDNKATLDKQGLEPLGQGPEAFAAYIAKDRERWAKVVKAGDIKAQ